MGSVGRASASLAPAGATPGKATRASDSSAPPMFDGGAPQWEDIDPSEHMHGVAQEGVAGGGGALPYREQIQRSFGRFDISNVRAHVGGKAAAAADQLGAAGYATGNDIALQPGASLHTVAHEAAHIVQQRSGVQLASGIGKQGDEYERNADAVADRVVKGESAEDLLAPYAGGASSGGGVQRQAVQLYQVVENDKLPWDRMSDDGRMAVSDHERDAWAEPDLIAQANKVLDQNKSRAKIDMEGGLKKVKAAGREHYLKKFKMVDRGAGFWDRNFGDDEVNLVDDCGGANQQMNGGEHLRDRRFSAATNAYGSVKEYTNPSDYKADDNKPGGIVSTTEQMSGEIYIRIMKREYGKTLGRVDALKEWDALSATKKDELSKKYGINKYAAPKMGEGVTIGSERDAPNAKSGGYNFHFSLNLMSAGEDYLALEDFDNSEVKYYFKMYGPASKGQSFAEEPDNQVAVADKATAMVVVHPHSLDGKVKPETPLKDARGKTLATLTRATKVKILLKGATSLEVEVLSGAHAGKRGWIAMNMYEHD
ncbi:MAG: DUF4157 domain-containing protein [Myxococcota bacterium]|nr:DUF4157 domain-containing protein [Myxococcota bacterium]